MTSINRLNQKTTPVDADLFPIWDSESSRTRAVSYKSIKDNIGDLSAGVHVESGTYSGGTLTLKLTNNTEVVITGWSDLTGINFKDDDSEVGNFDSVNFKGDGVQVSHSNGELQVEINKEASAPTLSLQFSGIYDTLQDLKDAIPSPTSTQQAIVIKPSEKYYHGVGGSWVELAPVGAFHPNYLGAYDTVQDLQAAEPTPADDSLAIVGTTAKSFYFYDGSKWDQLTHTDLPSLDARVTDVEGKVTTLETNNAKQDAEIKELQGRPDTPTFDSSMFASAVDHGYAADDQGIKSTVTTDGWWIFKDLKSVSGRPSDSVGELFVFKNEITTSNVALKHVFVMAIGQDQDLENKVWFAYRDGTQWTSWFDQIGSEQSVIDGLKTEIVKLKAGDATLVTEVSQLTSTIGAIYAPTKLAFNKAVTTLITAALANYTPVKPGHGGDKPALVFPRFYAQFSLGVPTDFTGATTSTNAEATLLRIPTTRERIFISVENDNDEASKVTGFKFNNKQEMSLAHRDIVRNGKKYRAFYTAGAFSEQKVDIKVDFGQGI